MAFLWFSLRSAEWEGGTAAAAAATERAACAFVLVVADVATIWGAGDGGSGLPTRSRYASAEARTSLGMTAISKRTSSASCVGVEGAFDETDANESTEEIEWDFEGGRCELVVTVTADTPEATIAGTYVGRYPKGRGEGSVDMLHRADTDVQADGQGSASAASKS